VNGVQVLFLAALGGSLGVLWRLLFLLFFQYFKALKSHFALLFVNALGCFVAGWIFGFWHQPVNGFDPVIFSFVVVGFLGSYTSVSAFSLETFVLLQHRLWGSAIGYVLASLVVCLAAFVLGWMLGSMGWSWIR